MKAKRARYQQGSIRKVSKSTGFAGKVRFSGRKSGKRYQRWLTFAPAAYPTEKDVRKALELTVTRTDAGAGAAKADAVCGVKPEGHAHTGACH